VTWLGLDDIKVALPAEPVPERRCAEPDCATVLSRYNDDERCFAHQPKDAPTG